MHLSISDALSRLVMQLSMHLSISDAVISDALVD